MKEKGKGKKEKGGEARKHCAVRVALSPP